MNSPSLLAAGILALLALPQSALCHPGSQPQGSSGSAEEPRVSIREENGKRVIESNGLPDHATGRFPNPGNPNTISAQNYRFEMPLQPRENSSFTATHRQPTAVAVNGVVFEPGTAEFWKNDPRSGWHMEAIGGPRNLGLDQNLAHVQPTGAYHYHGIPSGLIAEKNGSEKQMTLLGWAADGFPIYGPLAPDKANDQKSPLRAMKPSYRLKKGQRPGGSSGPGGRYDGSYTEDFEFIEGLGDLDQANGRRGVTPEYPEGTYYYVATESFPYLPRLFKGKPDPSFARAKGGPPGQRPSEMNRPSRPQEGGRQGQRPPPPF